MLCPFYPSLPPSLPPSLFHSISLLSPLSQVGRLDLGVSGSSGPSIAAGGVDFFLVSFSTDLPENVYNVRREGGREGGREEGDDCFSRSPAHF